MELIVCPSRAGPEANGNTVKINAMKRAYLAKIIMFAPKMRSNAERAQQELAQKDLLYHYALKMTSVFLTNVVVSR